MDLTVNHIIGDCRVVQVVPSATVGDLRCAVARSFGESVSVVQLCVKNSPRPLTLDNDSAPLTSFGLSHGSTVMLLLHHHLTVFITDARGQLKTYSVSKEETVDQLYEKVYHREGRPADQLILFYNYIPLEVGKRLKDYNIQSGSIIPMYCRLRG